MKLYTPFVICLAAITTLTITRAESDANAEPAAQVGWQPTLLVQLHVADLDRAITFYRDTLGFELESRNDEINWARIKPGIPGVTIGLGQGESQGSGTTSMNFGVDDVDAARVTLEHRGVTFIGPTIHIPNVVRLADFNDPDGNKIRLAGHPGEKATASAKPSETKPNSSLTPARASLNDLDFLVGAHIHSDDKQQVEEHWTAPAANSMTGMFRWIRNGKLLLHEIIILEQVEDHVEMRLRHFGASLEAWEDEPLVFTLTEIEANRALFVREVDGGHQRLTYTAEDGAISFSFAEPTPQGERSFGLTLQTTR